MLFFELAPWAKGLTFLETESSALQRRSDYQNEAKRTLAVGLPVVASQIAHMALGFIDTVMAGNLSAKDLGAVAIGRSLYVPLYIFALGIILATTPIVAQYLGAERKKDISCSLWQTLWLSVFLALPAFFLVRQVNILMYEMDIAADLIPITSGYLEAISWGIPAAFAYLSLRFFMDGLTLTRPNMYLTMMAIPLNILGNYLFMYGHWGFPKMGAVGAGYATALVWWFMLAGMTLLLLNARQVKALLPFQHFTLPDWERMKEFVRIGLPNGVSLGLEVSMFAVAALMIGAMGIAEIASHQIAINVASIAFMLPLGISIATSARVGFEIGQGSPPRAKIAGVVGMWIAIGCVLGTMAILLVFPETIVGIYTTDEQVLQLSVQLLFLAAVFQLPDGIQVSGAGALRGLKDTQVPMYANVLAYWGLGLPLGYYFGVFREMGPEGVWYGIIAGLFFTAFFHPLRFLSLMKAQIARFNLATNVIA